MNVDTFSFDFNILIWHNPSTKQNIIHLPQIPLPSIYFEKYVVLSLFYALRGFTMLRIYDTFICLALLFILWEKIFSSVQIKLYFEDNVSQKQSKQHTTLGFRFPEDERGGTVGLHSLCVLFQTPFASSTLSLSWTARKALRLSSLIIRKLLWTAWVRGFSSWLLVVHWNTTSSWQPFSSAAPSRSTHPCLLGRIYGHLSSGSNLWV